jgi:DNA repair exonuclease SbcCD nuclease subunit
MKIAHAADTHLGYAGFGLGALVEDPRRPGIAARQRQLDIHDGFVSAVDAAINAQAEVFLHSGDLFDSARPPAFAVDLAMSQFRRLTDAGMSVVIVEGNHSYPRDPALGHAFQILGHLPNVYVAYDAPRTFELAGVKIHAYPHRAVSRGAWPSPGETKGGVNILLAHGVADGQMFFRGDRPAPDLAVGTIANDFMYVALGHYHRHVQVPQTGNAFYAGASAMVTWGDFRTGHRFSISLVDPLADRTVVAVELPTRVMRAYGIDDASGLSRRDVLTFLAEQEHQLPARDANCRVTVEGLEDLVRREVNVREIEEIFAGASAMQVSLRSREQRWEAVQADIAEGGQLATRFAKIVGQLDAEPAFRSDVMALGESLLELADERLSDIDSEEAER